MLSLSVYFSFLGFAQAGDLALSWKGNGETEALKVWHPGELQALKSKTTHEVDPETGKNTSWKGVLLSQVLDKTLEQLTPDRRAQVDVLVFDSADGSQVLVPRFLITKYPLLLSLRAEGISVVLPWTSKPKIKEEGLPIASYFAKHLTGIELTTYRERYGNLFLKRRTDPAAMRGEKIFVQNCMGCHGQGLGPALTDLSSDSRIQSISSPHHPSSVKGTPELQDKDRRALSSYLSAYRSENPIEAHQESKAPAFAAPTRVSQ